MIKLIGKFLCRIEFHKWMTHASSWPVKDNDWDYSRPATLNQHCKRCKMYRTITLHKWT